MKKILIPTDFSPCAQNAADYAVALFAYEPVQFVLLNSYLVPHSTADTLITIDDILKRNSEEKLAEEVQRLHALNENRRAQFSFCSRPGDLTLVIRKMVKSQSMSLVVMGTGGNNGIRDLLMGTNTASVIRSAPCPVLAIPENARFVTPEHIVFAVDKINPLMNGNLGILKHVSATFRSHITLVHVNTGSSVLKDGDRIMAEQGQKAFDNRISLDAETVEDKNIIAGLQKYLAAHEDVQWVVMMPEKHAFPENLYHRSTTTRWVSQAPLPLLALRESY
ncbi:MAG: universal stress protein [Flavobacteriales bacterium]|nr:universal stress protein [Flavobacteriales bacterium]